MRPSKDMHNNGGLSQPEFIVEMIGLDVEDARRFSLYFNSW